MIVLDTNRLTVALALILTALMGPLVSAFGGENAFWPTAWAQWIIPFVLLAEVAIFAVILTSQRQVRTLTPAVVGALMLVGVRAGATLIGAGAYVWMRGEQTSGMLDVVFVDHWMGSPLALVLQDLLLIAVLPVALRLYAPGFLDQSALAKLQSGQQQFVAPVPMAQVIDASDLRAETHNSPLASIFLSTYEELSRHIDRMIGVEGHLLVSDEGLVISGRVTDDDNGDLAGELVRLTAAAEPMLSSGEAMPRQAYLHTADRWIATLPLPEGASIHLFLIERLSATQVAQTAARAADAARSLFAYRYGETSAAGLRALGVTTV